MKLPIIGNCACGSIKYKCNAEPVFMGNCHCRECQYLSGTSRSSVIAVPASSLEIQGNTLIYFDYIADSGNKVYRGFCNKCGTPMFSYSEPTKEYIGIQVGTLDEPNLFKPTADVWCSSAPCWEIMDAETIKFEKDMEM